MAQALTWYVDPGSNKPRFEEAETKNFALKLFPEFKRESNEPRSDPTLSSRSYIRALVFMKEDRGQEHWHDFYWRPRKEGESATPNRLEYGGGKGTFVPATFDCADMWAARDAARAWAVSLVGFDLID